MANFSQRNKRLTLIVVAIIIGIAIIAAIAIPLALRDRGGNNNEDESSNDGSPSESQATIGIQPSDCFPDAEGDSSKMSDSACRSRGCKYDAKADNTPVCSFYDKGYRLKVTKITATDFGFTINLEQVGSAPFGGDISSWVFKFENKGDNIARFTFDTADGKRYKVPKSMNLQDGISLTPNYNFKITNNESFAFQITRKETGTVIWDSDSIVLSDQYLQASTILPSTNVYGLGEQKHESLRHELFKTWPAFSRDQPPSFDDEANLYSVHPFYTCIEDKKGNTHGVLLLNSNAQEYAFSTLPSLTFRTIGGILDFYLFLGPTPENVIQQYTGVIGRPSIPPYWALGFQLCRYGYNNLSNLMDAVQSTAMYEIPHDVQYVDIDHMDAQMIFTVDERNFPDLNTYFKELRENGMRIIYILDPCLIANQTNYAPYDRLKAIDGFIKWENPSDVDDDSKDETGAMLGYVWPRGKTVFPDFMKVKVQEEWKNIIKEYRKSLVFDGLWIDMNEPANFGTNEERPWNWPEDEKPYWSLKCPKNSLEDPPYRTKVGFKWDKKGKQARLSDKTLCMGGIQGDNGQYRHYDVHSLFGWSQTKPTIEAAREATGERSIVISRSTFPGSGQHAGHWLGDNVSQWKDLHRSIIGILEFNVFGIPYIGADICGFFDDTTPELCKRWMQLGAFYTFSRNHNTLGAKPQGPGQMGDEVGKASRDIMRVRYQLLPYLYLLFNEAHLHGSTVIRPLHHEFPTDQTALSVDKQFMWGSCLLISPILEQGQTELVYYLPKGKWYNYFMFALEESEGVQKKVPVDADSMPLLHLRGGCIIIQQEYANNTHFSRQKPLTILAALDKSNNASGSFFWDDGVGIDTVGSGNYYKADIVLADSSMTLTVNHKPEKETSWTSVDFENLTVLGVDATIQSVKLQEPLKNQAKNLSFKQNGKVLNIELSGIGITQYDSFEVMWSIKAS